RYRLTRQGGARVLEEQDRWIEGKRPAHADAKAIGRVEFSHGTRTIGLRKSYLPRQTHSTLPHIVGNWIDLQGKREREVLHDRERVQQYGSLAHGSESI